MARAPSILIVDENMDDFLVLNRVFVRAGVMNPVNWVRSGEEATRYLSGYSPYHDRASHPLPSVILLDLNIPDSDAFELLRWIRGKFPSGGLLIVVLTRPDEIRKVNRAYSLGANSFLTKPARVGELQELIQIFGGYWHLNHRAEPAHLVSSSITDHFLPNPHEHN